MKDKIIDFLLDKANPSIVLRVKKEVLGSISPAEEASLLEKILTDRNVLTATACQKTNGWIGDYFHGSKKMFDNMEVGLRFLAEKGLPSGHEIIACGVKAVASTPKYDDAYGMSRLLADYDVHPEKDYSYTGVGVYLARSSILLRAGYEALLPADEWVDLQFDVDFSLRSFLSVLSIHSPDDILEERRGRLCFKQGVLWPCIYHLRMLAFSQSWRTEENIHQLAEAITALYAFPYKGFAYTYCMNQLKGPCMPLAINTPVNETLAQGQIGGMYFDRLELLARCGALSRVAVLKNEYEMLLECLDAHGLFTREVASKYALGWSPYFGFALEEDWRSKYRKQCDILFRILLIMHHAAKVKPATMEKT